jgi:epoxyqueuosine reductase
MLNIKEEIKSLSKETGISLIGFTTSDRLKNLPSGKVLDATILKGVNDVLPSAKSIIILAYHIWDPVFNLVLDGPKWRKKDVLLDNSGSEFYQLYSEVLDSKAWKIANFIQRKTGADVIVNREICLKKAAIEAGLGVQGKNTLVINPRYGPFIRFTAILTSSEFEPDEPLSVDVCKDCMKCIQACPTKALTPYKIDIRRCLTYAVEHPEQALVSDDVRDLEKKLIKRPTVNSYIECTICQDVCKVHNPSARAT